MPKKLRPAVDLMAFKCRTLKVKFLSSVANIERSFLWGRYFGCWPASSASTANTDRIGYLQQAVWSSLNNKLYMFGEEYEPGGVHLQRTVNKITMRIMKIQRQSVPT
jgi:hypothetical protein